MAKTTLSTGKEISAVLRSGCRFKSRYICFHWLPSSDIKIAITCAKKSLRKAVDRNYFKRINRVEFRSKLSTQKLRLLVIARPKISEVPKEDLGKVVTSAWTSFIDQYRAA